MTVNIVIVRERFLSLRFEEFYYVFKIIFFKKRNGGEAKRELFLKGGSIHACLVDVGGTFNELALNGKKGVEDFEIVVGVFDDSFLFVFGVGDDEAVSELCFATVFGWVSGETWLTDDVVCGDKSTFFDFIHCFLGE